MHEEVSYWNLFVTVIGLSLKSSTANLIGLNDESELVDRG